MSARFGARLITRKFLPASRICFSPSRNFITIPYLDQPLPVPNPLLSMQEPKAGQGRGGGSRGPRRFNRKGKRPASTAAQAQGQGQNQAQNESPAPISRVATPPLADPVPQDTPRFAELGNLVHPTLVRTVVEDMKFNHMTPVQAATIHELLRGQDVLAQAKTGTGKTTAFLLPAIQRLITSNRNPGQNVSLLVISPTRELALQIAQEGRKLLQRLPQYSVCTAIGGTNQNREERQILNGCDILVATPGRLLDYLTNNGEDSLLLGRMQSLDTLVFDEADRLLDMGFLRDIKRIVGLLPDKNTTQRQGMMFSATMGDHVESTAHLALSKDYKFISTIPKGEQNTHQRVPQHVITVPTFSDMAAGLLGALRQEMSRVGRDKFKAIVFAPTAAQVDFYAEILQQFSDLPSVVAIHSRLSQSKRTKVTEDFRKATNGILIATDVIARGIDIKEVTNVFQAGIPADKESYVHRLGRTARAGAEGCGTLILSSHESYFPTFVLKDTQLVEQAAELSAKDEIAAMASQLDPEVQKKAYQAWLGFYKALLKHLRWDVDRLVQEANEYAMVGLGAAQTPTLYKSVVGKMGLRGVKGLKVGPDPPKAPRGPRKGEGR